MNANTPRRPWLLPALLLSTLLAAAPGCGNRGDGGYGPVTLQGIDFGEQAEGNGNKGLPPSDAPLLQAISFLFSGRVPPGEVDSEALPVRDTDGRAVEGDYAFEDGGRRVTFYPAFPREPITDLGDGQWDTGGAALQPATFFDVRVETEAGKAISTLIAIDESVWARYDRRRDVADGWVGRLYEHGARSGPFGVRFRTTDDPARFLAGFEAGPPRLVATDPADGASGVSPFLFTDPEDLFPTRESLRLVFDQPLDPAEDNIGLASFELVDLKDARGRPLDIELAVKARLAANRHDRAVVEVIPQGILPFGDELALTYATALRSLSGEHDEDSGHVVAAVFDVACAPPAGSPEARDAFVESFETSSRRAHRFASLDEPAVAAEWDENDSNVLQAGRAFRGNGELGPFMPVAPESGTREIVLDTNSQTFPLFDGSTPDAPPMTVEGGVFSFTDIVIPQGILVRGQGSNALVLTATGSVMISGDIDVSGLKGGEATERETGITPVPGGPGGPGGGRGGRSNPSVWEGEHDLANLVPARYAEAGRGPTGSGSPGGGGGEGTAYPDPEWPAHCGESYCSHADDGSCDENGCPSTAEFSRGAGGGGGSFLGSGAPGRQGRGSVVSLEALDERGYPQFADNPGGNRSQGGAAGVAPFADEDPLNDFIGPQGELIQPIGGQGGGGGGNRHDSLMCADWVFEYRPGFPAVLTDSRGGAGGGGGGVFLLEALGPVLFTDGATILARGGDGGGGEDGGCATWAGCGGGGAGGAVIIDSATSVTMGQLYGGVFVDVRGGKGAYAQGNCPNRAPSCGSKKRTNPGSGGDGGAGLIQIQTPPGVAPDLEYAHFRPEGSLVPPERTPSTITPLSVGQSVWIDAGQVIRREGRPAWSFTGTDDAGRVATDAKGRIPTPRRCDFEIALPPVIDEETGIVLEEGRENYIPPGAWIRIEFQAASAVAPGSHDIDPATIVPAPGVWSPDISVARGHQFIRYRVVFNIADLDEGSQPGTHRRRSIMRWLRLPFDF